MQSMTSAPARIGKTTGKASKMTGNMSGKAKPMGKASTKPVSKTIMADKSKYPGLINR